MAISRCRHANRGYSHEGECHVSLPVVAEAWKTHLCVCVCVCVCS